MEFIVHVGRIGLLTGFGQSIPGRLQAGARMFRLAAVGKKIDQVLIRSGSKQAGEYSVGIGAKPIGFLECGWVLLAGGRSKLLLSRTSRGFI
ncbi:MAG: hypothetical protein KGY49_04990 [Wenzhouxiangellaceae bacterium]|nr:hypothetical protein [Wenzhouxiangellaceae bacterium]